MKKSNVKIDKVLVTPSQASIWLLKNVANRPLNEKQVKFFSRQIEKGRWELTTDAIGFDGEGKLINGQHRLTAIVKTGKAQDLLVGTGFSAEAFNVIDTGKMRNAGDILGVNGIGAGVPKSAIIRFVMGLSKGYIPGSMARKGGSNDIRLSNQDILEYAEKHKTKLEDAYEVSVKTTKEFKGLSGRYVAGLYWLFSSINRDEALLFFHYLGTGITLRADDPVYVLRKRLMVEMINKKKSPDVDKLAWTVLAWNHTRAKKKVTKLVWNGEEFPRPL